MKNDTPIQPEAAIHWLQERKAHGVLPTHKIEIESVGGSSRVRLIVFNIEDPARRFPVDIYESETVKGVVELYLESSFVGDGDSATGIVPEASIAPEDIEDALRGPFLQAGAVPFPTAARFGVRVWRGIGTVKPWRIWNEGPKAVSPDDSFSVPAFAEPEVSGSPHKALDYRNSNTRFESKHAIQGFSESAPEVESAPYPLPSFAVPIFGITQPKPESGISVREVISREGNRTFYRVFVEGFGWSVLPDDILSQHGVPV